MESPVDISLLLPTRGRPELLRRLFNSVAVTTAAIDRLELVLYIDEDDAPTQDLSHDGLPIVRLIKPAQQTMGRMNQACYEASRGRFVMLMNDDVVFRTPGWDRHLVASFQQFGDEIALVYGNDLYQRQALPTMPVLSRVCCELLDGICPRSYRRTYIDLHIYDLFKKLAKLGPQRIVYHDDVIFEHMHHETGKAALDATYVKNSEGEDDKRFISLEDERWNQAKMLKRHIESRAAKASPSGADRRVGR
ncbi:MAG: hypothetical protein FJ143_13145, partial [Deltaproteobacteria bacterium]|nr:hypothetical protein [Deltaproteobacteria bacterium]